MYGKWGFRDSVNTTTGHVSDGYLSLDQGMVMAALGNALGNDVMRPSFATASFKQAIRPVLGVEEFTPRHAAARSPAPPGNDVLPAPAATTSSAVSAATTSINAGSGDDVVYGDAGNDSISGGAGDDNLYGDDGDDSLSGGNGDDVLAAGPGADHLMGDRGADHLEGQQGTNTCVSDKADDLAADC